MNKNSFGKVVNEKKIMRGLKEIETEIGFSAYVVTMNFANKHLSETALDFMKGKCDGKYYYFQKTNSDVWLILAYELLDVYTECFNEKKYSDKAFKMYLETTLSKSYPQYSKSKEFYINNNKNKPQKVVRATTKEMSVNNDLECEGHQSEDTFDVWELLKKLYLDGYSNIDVETYIQKNKGDMDFLFEKANEYYDQGLFLDAKRVYLEILKHKKSYRVCYNLGVAYTKAHEPEVAVKLYEKAIQLNPKYASAFFNLGLETYKLDVGNNRGKALIYFKNAYGLNPEDDECKKAITTIENEILEAMMSEA